MTELDLRPLDAAFGTEVLGMDLAAVSDAELPMLQAALRDHALLLFRRQSLTDLELEAFSARFGRLEVPANDNLSPYTRHITYISNLAGADGKPLGQLGSRELVWHSDQDFRRDPATLAVLFAVEVPMGEGATWWCNTRLGYEALPAHLRERIQGLRGCYRPSDTQNIEKVTVSHPLVLPHPVGNRWYLYVSERTRAIEGLPDAESSALIAELLRYQLRPEHQYVHPWRMGDLILYDNGQTLHRRDEFQGHRFMKATRVFLSPEAFAVPA